HRLREGVAQGQPIVARSRPRSRQFPQRPIQSGGRGFAEIDLGRYDLAAAAQYASQIGGLDRAAHFDGDFRSWTGYGPTLHTVAGAIGIFTAARAAADGDLPIQHLLALKA